MATFGDVITRILANVGDSRSGNTGARERILEDLSDFIQYELPSEFGGQFTEDFATLAVGGVGGTADGVYAYSLLTPNNRIRSLTGPVILEGNSSPWHPSAVYRNPTLFWTAFDIFNPTQVGVPSAVLIYGETLTFRIIPDTAVAALDVRIFGTFYPIVASGLEADTIPRDEDIPLLVAQGTVLHARRKVADTVLAQWQPRLAVLKSERRIARANTVLKSVSESGYLASPSGRGRGYRTRTTLNRDY